MTLDEDVQTMSTTRKINSFLVSFAGGIVTGGVVAAVNHAHGTEEMMHAGIKQFLYTLTVGGIGVWLCRRFQRRDSNLVRKTIEATMYPSIFTFMVNWEYHTLFETPEAFYSGLATGGMAVATFLPYTLYAHHRLESRI